MICNSYEHFFSVMANPTRLSIMKALMDGPMCVTEIGSRLCLEQSKVSHSLRVLAKCHFVHARPKGRKRYYNLNKKTIKPLMGLVHRHVTSNCGRCWVEK